PHISSLIGLSEADEADLVALLPFAAERLPSLKLAVQVNGKNIELTNVSPAELPTLEPVLKEYINLDGVREIEVIQPTSTISLNGGSPLAWRDKKDSSKLYIHPIAKESPHIFELALNTGLNGHQKISSKDELFNLAKIGQPKTEGRTNGKINQDSKWYRMANQFIVVENSEVKIKTIKLDSNIDIQALAALPGIGPKLSINIKEYIDKNGPIQSKQQLLEVPGIGEKRFARISPFLDLPADKIEKSAAPAKISSPKAPAGVKVAEAPAGVKVAEAPAGVKVAEAPAAVQPVKPQAVPKISFTPFSKFPQQASGRNIGGLIIADVHGQLDAFTDMLISAGFIDEQFNWKQGVKAELIQLGDVIDRGPNSIECYRLLRKLQEQARQNGGRVVRLLGNHELMILQGDLRYALQAGLDLAQIERLQTDIIEDIKNGNIVAAHQSGDRILVHAGIVPEISQNKPVGDLVKELNQKLVNAARNNDYSDPIFGVGRSRGGLQEYPGIFWADFNDDLSPIADKLMPQVVGHTPLDENNNKVNYIREKGNVINIDVGIAEYYGGGRDALALVESTPQIGKMDQLERIEGNVARISTPAGPRNLSLTPQGTLDLRGLASQIEAMQDIDQTYKQVVLGAIRLLEHSPPAMSTFTENIDDFLGFASVSTPTQPRQPNLIGLHQSLANNPIAKFHELGEYLIKSGAMNLSLQGNDLIITNNTGQEIGRVTLTPDYGLKQINKDPSNPHYLLRGLAREVFKTSDIALTQEIKAQKSISSDMPQLVQQEVNLPRNTDRSFDYTQPITVNLAPNTEGTTTLSIYRYEDIPDSNPVKFQLNPSIEFFIVQEGNPNGFKALRDGEVVDIGRNNPGRFNLNNLASREHLRVQRQGDRIILTDLNSRNGTRVRYGGSSISQIGKMDQLERIEGNVARISTPAGPRNLSLTPQGTLDLSALASQIEAMQDIDQTYKQVVLGAIRLLEHSPPAMSTFTENIDDFLGFASTSTPAQPRQPNLIGLHQSLANNPIAKFHELGEYLIKSGAMNLSLQGNDLIITNNTGQEIGRVTLTPDYGLKQINKDPSNPHYLLRGLAREVFKTSDIALTQEIKAQKGIGVKQLAQEIRDISKTTGLKVPQRIRPGQMEVVVAEMVQKWYEIGRLGTIGDQLSKLGVDSAALERDLRGLVINDILGKLENAGSLSFVERGGDLEVWSHPDLDFVVKFTYGDANFDSDVLPGYRLAEDNLGGLAAAMILEDVDLNLGGQIIHQDKVIIQEKVEVIGRALERLETQGNLAEAKELQDRFVDLNHQMWKRGILDQDPNWTENYGLTDRGQLVIIDIGAISENADDFDFYEGLPRQTLYDQTLRSHFSKAEFDKHWSTAQNERSRVPFVGEWQKQREQSEIILDHLNRGS
ncbi:MAG: helix-hairpin-helix domain-containing protein, partial [Candidatus Omnitrophota bacterium]